MIELEENEKLVTVFRKHIFYFLTEVGGVVLIAFIPPAVYSFLEAFFAINFLPQSEYLLVFIYLLFLTILWNISFVLWTDYYLDIWILTDKRLIDVEQKGLFSREVSSLRLENIQDVKWEVSGLIETFVDMGSVSVQTAASEKEFVIRNAKNPKLMKETIFSAHHQEMEKIKTVRVEHETA